VDQSKSDGFGCLLRHRTTGTRMNRRANSLMEIVPLIARRGASLPDFCLIPDYSRRVTPVRNQISETGGRYSSLPQAGFLSERLARKSKPKSSLLCKKGCQSAISVMLRDSQSIESLSVTACSSIETTPIKTLPAIARIDVSSLVTKSTYRFQSGFALCSHSFSPSSVSEYVANGGTGSESIAATNASKLSRSTPLTTIQPFRLSDIRLDATCWEFLLCPQRLSSKQLSRKCKGTHFHVPRHASRSHSSRKSTSRDDGVIGALSFQNSHHRHHRP